MNDTTRSADLIRRAGTRLADSTVIWMTTVNSHGQPQTSPVWYLIDGDELLVYSLDSPRVRNVIANPRVALNLDGDGDGGAIVTLEGTARVAEDQPPCWEVAEYVAKYGAEITAMNYTPRTFGETYRVPLRIRLTAGRMW